MILCLAKSEQIVPGLADVDNVNTIWSGLPEVWLHVNLQVLGSEVALSCEEHLNVLGGSIENGWELGWCHLCDLTYIEGQIGREELLSAMG